MIGDIYSCLKCNLRILFFIKIIFIQGSRFKVEFLFKVQILHFTFDYTLYNLSCDK